MLGLSDEIFDKIEDLHPNVVYNEDDYRIMPLISEEQEKQWREQLLDRDTTASLQQMSLCSTLISIDSSSLEQHEYPSNKFDISMLANFCSFLNSFGGYEVRMLQLSYSFQRSCSYTSCSYFLIIRRQYRICLEH